MADTDPFTTQSSPHQWIDVRIYSINADFLLPYLQPCARFVDQPEEADFLLTMNSTEPHVVQTLADARRFGKPIAWWTIEDPNSLNTFLEQALQADFVFTTDEACISHYQRHLTHDRVFWLPLACSPEFHYELPLIAEATDFVISANWYQNEARLWGVRTVVDPILQAGHSLTLFCYSSLPFLWPAEYQRYWLGETSCRTVAQQYRHGLVVLGLNNQRSGMDGREVSYMTSMRTFEALACGKPLLASASDAYERLGLVNGEHMVWVSQPADAVAWGERLLDGIEGARIAKAGRAFVLATHTYGHRLMNMAEHVIG